MYRQARTHAQCYRESIQASTFPANAVCICAEASIGEISF
eukprot:jgi/Antlo1/1413/1380